MKLNIEHVPTIILIKDLSDMNGPPRYVQMSNICADFMGWGHPENSYGKTDYEVPSDICEHAEEFIHIDHLVRNGQGPIKTIEFLKTPYGWKKILVEKKMISEHLLFFQAMHLNATFFPDLLENIENCHQTVWQICENYPHFSLTRREQECLFYLIRGKSGKQIAYLLNTSVRTIEYHIDNIKIKLNCGAKSDIIGKAFDEGFAYFIPTGLINLPI